MSVGNQSRRRLDSGGDPKSRHPVWGEILGEILIFLFYLFIFIILWVNSFGLWIMDYSFWGKGKTQPFSSLSLRLLPPSSFLVPHPFFIFFYLFSSFFFIKIHQSSSPLTSLCIKLCIFLCTLVLRGLGLRQNRMNSLWGMTTKDQVDSSPQQLNIMCVHSWQWHSPAAKKNN